MPRRTRRQLVDKRQEDAEMYEREALLKRLTRELRGPNKPDSPEKILAYERRT